MPKRLLPLLFVGLLLAGCSSSTSTATPSTTPSTSATPTPTPSAVQSGPVPSLDPSQPLPWMAAIVPANSNPADPVPFCSGDVIDPSWVLTAGHCTGSASGSAVTVAVVTGRRDLTDTSTGQFIKVDQSIRMPGWSSKSGAYYNDFTLLHLVTKSTTTPAPVVTPAQYKQFKDGSLVIAAGWGSLTASGQPVQTVHATELERLADSICATEYGSLYEVGMHVCAGWKWPSMTHDTCTGDSGGPLAWQVDGKYVVVATTSWGSTCFTEGVPGVYSSVAHAYDWITSTISSP